MTHGQGIAHTANSASSISTGITRRFQLADVIVLVDSAAQPMQAAPVNGWVEAYNHRGTGSTRVRARELVGLYESAAPVPNEMPGPDANEFLFELRELVAESVVEDGGELLGWSRDASVV